MMWLLRNWCGDVDDENSNDKVDDDDESDEKCKIDENSNDFIK